MSSYYRDPAAPEPTSPRRIGVAAAIDLEALPIWPVHRPRRDALLQEHARPVVA